MSLFVDIKYVSLVSPRLERFQHKSTYLWNFRCNLCGDSKKNKTKARAYIYRRKNDLFFNCHNCGASHTFGTFLKMSDRSLYDSYRLECYSEGMSTKVKKPDLSAFQAKPDFKPISPKIDLPTVEELPEDHIARVYVKRRQIPKEKHSQLFYADNFHTFVMRMLPSFDKKVFSEPRLILPFYDEENVLLGFSGRALLDSPVKYITIKLSESNRKIYGLNSIDKSKPIYVTEGPIDSLFLENAVATMDAALYNIIPQLGSQHDYVFIYDNEPRNKHILRAMQKTIEMGKSICIWPSNIDQKDINDMVVKGGLSPSAIRSIIDTNTFSGLQANLEFGRWKKI